MCAVKRIVYSDHQHSSSSAIMIDTQQALPKGQYETELFYSSLLHSYQASLHGFGCVLWNLERIPWTSIQVLYTKLLWLTKHIHIHFPNSLHNHTQGSILLGQCSNWGIEGPPCWSNFMCEENKLLTEVLPLPVGGQRSLACECT